jgi:hypothetical protein
VTQGRADYRLPRSARVAPAIGQARQTVRLAIQEAIAARNVLLLDCRDRLGVATVREVETVAFAGMAGPRSTPPGTPRAEQPTRLSLLGRRGWFGQDALQHAGVAADLQAEIRHLGGGELTGEQGEDFLRLAV